MFGRIVSAKASPRFELERSIKRSDFSFIGWFCFRLVMGFFPGRYDSGFVRDSGSSWIGISALRRVLSAAWPASLARFPHSIESI
jgi:hypothetical protein